MRNVVKNFWGIYQRLQQWYNRRTLVERFLFFALCLFGLALTFGAVNFLTLQKKSVVLDKNTKELNAQINLLSTAISDMDAKLKNMSGDETDFIRKNPGYFQDSDKLAKVNMKDYLVQANTMESFFEATLDKVHGMTMIKMDHKVEQVTSSGKKLPIYRHTYHLTLAGNYLSTYAYLKELETVEWRLFWNTLDYKVSDYPSAIIELEVFVLSEQE